MSDGSRDEAGGGVWGSVHGKGTFGGEFGAPVVTNGVTISRAYLVLYVNALLQSVDFGNVL